MTMEINLFAAHPPEYEGEKLQAKCSHAQI